jgi:endonuclease/exonuclease/phosphatase family metal-dependent hydrolase
MRSTSAETRLIYWHRLSHKNWGASCDSKFVCPLILNPLLEDKNMRIASFNLENLFSRASALNDTVSEGKPILVAYSRFNTIILEPVYTEKIKSDLLEVLSELGLDKNDDNENFILRQNRGRLVKRSKEDSPKIIAEGRSDWIGWLELKTEAVNEIATVMTARVIKDVNADILAVVEAEDRIALTRFNDQLLKPIEAAYSEIMLIDGNDDRGIDVGLLTKSGIQIESMVSHVSDKRDDLTIFSRDCPEYMVRINSSTSILVLVNHFKSKGYGTPKSSNARRRLQAQRVREIYDKRRTEGIEFIAVVGDLNDTPDSQPLEPLLKDGSDLQDITTHPKFVSDGREGTYANGAASNKIDYLLLSPELFNKVTSGGIFRRGVWGGVNGDLFPHYDEITKPIQAASDHAAIWADIDL